MSNVETNVKKVASFLDSWWKIISILSLLVFFIYEISVVWFQISQMEKEMEILKNEIENVNKLQDERMDKRFNQLEGDLKDIIEKGINLTEEFKQHLIDNAKDKGTIFEGMKWLEKDK